MSDHIDIDETLDDVHEDAHEDEADAIEALDQDEDDEQPEKPRIDSDEMCQRVVEAILLAANEPLTPNKILNIIDDESVTIDEVRAHIDTITQDYETRNTLVLKQLASGYQFQIENELSVWVSKLWQEKPPRYSRAFLETLALIAYRQPTTRGEIEEIRGVSVSTYIIKSLMDREWIRVIGHREVPGRPALYGTTKQFLDYFNLKSLDELPSLPEIQEMVESTTAPETDNVVPLFDAADGAEASLDEQTTNDEFVDEIDERSDEQDESIDEETTHDEFVDESDEHSDEQDESIDEETTNDEFVDEVDELSDEEDESIETEQPA